MIERQKQSFEDMAKLLGHNVKIVLDWDDSEGTITGYFFALDVEGNVTVDTKDGRHYGWPALYIEHLPECRLQHAKRTETHTEASTETT